MHSKAKHLRELVFPPVLLFHVGAGQGWAGATIPTPPPGLSGGREKEGERAPSCSEWPELRGKGENGAQLGYWGSWARPQHYVECHELERGPNVCRHP